MLIVETRPRASLVAALFVPDIYISVDIIFITMYICGVVLLLGAMKLVDQLFKPKAA